MGVWDWLTQVNQDATESSGGFAGGGGVVDGIFQRSPAVTTPPSASTTTNPMESDDERWNRQEIDKALRLRREAEIQRDYGPPPVDIRTQQEIDEANLRVAIAEANKQKLENEIQRQNDPETRELLKLQVEQARLAVTKAQNELKDSMTAEQRLRLEDQLARQRAVLTDELAAARSERDYERILERERLAAEREGARDDRRFGQELALDERRGQRDLLSDQTSLAVQIRNQEIARLKAQDDFVSQAFQNEIAAGRLSLEKAAKQMDAYIQRSRLPTEIMRNVMGAVEPLLPYMTSANAGDIPLGFEKGGTRDVIGRLGGNAPSAHQPSQYAVKPVTVDPFALAKQAGADFSASKVPDPGKLFGAIGIPTAPTGGTSATSAVGDIGQYVGQAKAMQGGLMAGLAPLPPGVMPSAADREQLKQGIGGG